MAENQEALAAVVGFDLGTARRLKLTRYWGAPCGRGHGLLRRTTNRQCVVCYRREIHTRHKRREKDPNDRLHAKRNQRAQARNLAKSKTPGHPLHAKRLRKAKEAIRRKRRTPGHPARLKHQDRVHAIAKRKRRTPGTLLHAKAKARRNARVRRQRRIPGTPQHAKAKARRNARNRRVRRIPGHPQHAKAKTRSRNLVKRKQRIPGTPRWLRVQLRRILRRVRADSVGRPIKKLHGLTTRELLGCTGEEFTRHVEAQWQPGWTWKNRGPNGLWEIHHKVAVASYDGARENLLRICHYTNWQALSVEDHRAEHATCSATG